MSLKTEDLRRLGLHGSGQMRMKNLIHNGGWYNQDGEKLGWGDLAATDLNRIATLLTPGEVFITLGEHDSHWAFQAVSREGPLRKLGLRDEQTPGQMYVLARARWAVFPHEVFGILSDHSQVPEGEPVRGYEHYGEFDPPATWLSRATFCARLGVTPPDEEQLQEYMAEVRKKLDARSTS